MAEPAWLAVPTLRETAAAWSGAWAAATAAEMAMSFDLGSYVDVDERLRMFYERFPEGSLTFADPKQPVRVVQAMDRTFLECAVLAYRTPDDPAPGAGVAWEPFPGGTPYTRNSEAMNAQTSAWGRAIKAVMFIAGPSADEVRNRKAERADTSSAAAPADAEHDKAKRDLWEVAKKAGLTDAGALSSEYGKWSNGEFLADATTRQLLAFTKHLTERAAVSA